MNIEQALEESFNELGIDFGSNLDDILFGTDENVDDTDAEDEAADTGTVEENDSAKETVGAEDDESDRPVVELPENGVLRLPDGTEVDVKQAVLLQADYTKKTQQVAEERKNLDRERETLDGDRQKVAETYQQMRDWYEKRSSDPTGWVEEIVGSSPDPTSVIAKALYQLAHSGKLDAAFVQTFGIDAGEIAQRAAQSDRDRELDDLRKRVEQRDRTEQDQKAIREQAQRYQSEWDAIKQANSLAFESSDAEIEAKRELFNFATEKRMVHSLTDAYDLMRVKKAPVEQPTAIQATVPDLQVTKNKRASRAVTPKGDVAGGPAIRRPKSTREAALQALDEFAKGA